MQSCNVQYHSRQTIKRVFFFPGLLVRNRLRILISLCLVIFHTAVLSAQSDDYRVIFSGNWEKAQSFLDKNESWMKAACERYDIDFPFAAAIIFPELIRYSALRDRIEISLLQTLYINLGEEYADFSVGQFQMKPSFAEQVREKAGSSGDRKIRKMFRSRSYFGSPLEYRESIVSDLEDINSQMNYLISFIRICETRFRRKWGNANDKLRFFATAYNCGLDKDAGYIESMSQKKYFSTKLVPAVTYSYPEISVFWYNQYFSQDKITNR